MKELTSHLQMNNNRQDALVPVELVVTLSDAATTEEFFHRLCLWIENKHQCWAIVIERGQRGKYTPVAQSSSVPPQIAESFCASGNLPANGTACVSFFDAAQSAEFILVFPGENDYALKPAIRGAQAIFPTVAERQRYRAYYHKLIEQSQMLETLVDVVRDVQLTDSWERLLYTAGLRLLGHTITTRGFIAVVDRGSGIHLWAKGIQLNNKIVSSILEHVHSATSIDTFEPAELREYLEENGIRYLLPLIGRQNIIGVIGLGARLGKNQSYLSDEFLPAYATAVAAAVEHLALMEAQVEKERLERELALARAIQQRLLPSVDRLSKIEGVEIAAHLSPAHHVSGDYYDVALQDDGVLLAIADVCGKGIGAALIMAHLHASFHLLASMNASPAQVLAQWNQLLLEHTDSGSFVTAVVVHYNPDTKVIRYACAGHPAPLIVTCDGSVQELGQRDVVLGVLEAVEYHQEELPLPERSALCLYTDGVSEARNLSGKEFGTEQVAQVLASAQCISAAEYVERICSALGEHSAGCAVHDDWTVVVMRNPGV
ncbi:MAG: PP2C family protein-serine/threonine phosphatase [Bacteroidota bacterium]|nr:PP2C family protein-serine/threonine phosphatase [Bacteroidota bacterium]